MAMPSVRAALKAVLVALLLGTAALTGLVVAATPSFACSCAGPSIGPDGQDAEPAARAATVVVGTVVDRYVPPSGLVVSSADPAVWTVRVETVLKGSAVALERVTTPMDEASCGGLGPGVGVNSRAVLFLRAQDPPVLGARYASSLCSGGRIVSSAADVAFPGAVSASPSPGGSIPDGSPVTILGVAVPSGGRALPLLVLAAGVAVLLAVAAGVAVRTRRR